MSTSPPLSLHQTIVDALEAKIMDGTWPPGSRVPSEAALVETFGCARMTVNKALAQLVRAGLIERRRRTGTIVARPGVRSAVMEIADVRTEVQATGARYTHEIVARSVKGNRLQIATLHRADDAPFAYEQRTIFLDRVPTARSETFDEHAPGSWLLFHVPWTEAENVIRAAPADAHVASALAIAQNSACLVIERRTWQQGAPVTHVVFHYPAAGHQVVARFSPNSIAV